MARKTPAGEPEFDQGPIRLAKQELGGNCVPKPELGNETRCVKRTLHEKLKK